MFSATTAPIGRRGPAGYHPRNAREKSSGLALWERRYEGTSVFVRSRGRGKYLLQPSGVRGLLGRKLVNTVSCSPGRNLRGEIPRGPRGTGTPRLPRVSGRGHGLTVAPCPLPLVFSFSFPASSFFLARADRHASGTPATPGQLLTNAGALFSPASQPTLSQLCLVGPQPPSHHPIEFSAAIHRAACEYVYVYTCNCLLSPRAPRLPSTPRTGWGHLTRSGRLGCHAGVALFGLGGYVTRPEGR